ncbi:MAG: hypothetical protein ABS938_12800 [Psychrobacillus psychrodurans]
MFSTSRLGFARGGQQDVGHKGFATGRGALSLCSPHVTEITVLFIL